MPSVFAVERSTAPMDETDRRRLAELHEHLLATAEQPVDREASRWIGEAEAVAGDLVGAAVDPDVVEERIGHVVDLLAKVEETGDPAATQHVEAAQDTAETLLEE